MTEFLCFHDFVYPCCLKARYKAKFKSNVVFIILIIIAYHPNKTYCFLFMAWISNCNDHQEYLRWMLLLILVFFSEKVLVNLTCFKMAEKEAENIERRDLKLKAKIRKLTIIIIWKSLILGHHECFPLFSHKKIWSDKQMSNLWSKFWR